MRRSRPEGARSARSGRRALLVLAATLIIASPGAVSMDLGGRGVCRAEPPPSSPPAASPAMAPGAPDAADPHRPPPGTILLLLPAVTGRGGEWIVPWAAPSESARFAKLEEELSARFGALGYGVITIRQALASAGAASALRDAPRPLTPEAAAGAARSARATLALLLRADALRRTEPKQIATDALVSAEVYRAADAVKLAWGSTKVSGTGPTETEADAAALSHAAGPLFDALAGPLLAAVRRPVIAAHPITVIIEGDLGYRDYRRLIGLVQHEIPEIRELQERRFSHGRQALRAICACQPWDISQRLDGRTTGGFLLDVRAELDAIRVRARPASAGGFRP